MTANTSKIMNLMKVVVLLALSASCQPQNSNESNSSEDSNESVETKSSEMDHKSGSHFNYSDQPAWRTGFPDCGGQKQSPIDLDLKTHHKKNAIIRLNSRYNRLYKFSVTNTGHSAQFTPLSGPKMILKFGDDRFVLDQFHFHWGLNDSIGSEHSINGERFPLEMHLVHHNIYQHNLTSAQGQKNGVLVLGALFQVSKEAIGRNANFYAITSSLARVVNASTTIYLKDRFSVNSLLPKDVTTSFYTYSGSLTTPPCSEKVIWIVARNFIIIDSQQVAEFRNLQDGNDEPLTTNCRHVQAINNRIVSSTLRYRVSSLADSQDSRKTALHPAGHGEELSVSNPKGR